MQQCSPMPVTILPLDCAEKIFQASKQCPHHSMWQFCWPKNAKTKNSEEVEEVICLPLTYRPKVLFHTKLQYVLSVDLRGVSVFSSLALSHWPIVQSIQHQEIASGATDPIKAPTFSKASQHSGPHPASMDPTLQSAPWRTHLEAPQTEQGTKTAPYWMLFISWNSSHPKIGAHTISHHNRIAQFLCVKLICSWYARLKPAMMLKSKRCCSILPCNLPNHAKCSWIAPAKSLNIKTSYSPWLTLKTRNSTEIRISQTLDPASTLQHSETQTCNMREQ